MSDFFQLFSQVDIGDRSPEIIFAALLLATFVSEDLACVTAGALAGQGVISLPLAITACFVGIFLGDLLLFTAGRFFGQRLLQFSLFSRFVSDSSIERASVWLERNGLEAIFLSRFVTGLRLPTYLAAGFLRTDVRKFSLYFLLASLVWTPILVGFSAFSTQSLSKTNVIIAIFLIFAAIRLTIHFSSWKNRRLFVGRLTRWVHWEFWPLWIFYLPVFVYVLSLAFRYRSLTVFTCSNPAIPAGGFIGESKSEIYERLQLHPVAEPYLLPYILLSAKNSASENLALAKTHIADNTLSFPLIFKPDVGERGKGVTFIRDFDDLESHLNGMERDTISQEYFGGEEVSIFYYRYPHEEKGRIFSITEKNFPRLTGDGISDVETLILRDRRAVALAKKYFEQNTERLGYVPEEGEKIKILDIGTHSRGAMFSDGGHFRTAVLEEKIDEICRGYEGFYFGRFDIRCRSFEALKRGESFKIIELNGVTSESTNIYDRKYSLFDAYRILFRQWAIAFEIGRENFQRGVKPTGVADLIKLIFGIRNDSPVRLRQLRDC